MPCSSAAAIIRALSNISVLPASSDSTLAPTRAIAWIVGMPTTGFSDVRQIALTRLALEDIPSVQVDWTLYGPKLAQVALTVGADDLDGVPAVDDVSMGARRATLEDLRRNITAAGLTPFERTGRHSRLDG